MKKIRIIGIILISLFFPNLVKAEDVILCDAKGATNGGNDYINPTEIINKIGINNINESTQIMLENYKNNYDTNEYKNFSIWVSLDNTQNNKYRLNYSFYLYKNKEIIKTTNSVEIQDDEGIYIEGHFWFNEDKSKEYINQNEWYEIENNQASPISLEIYTTGSTTGDYYPFYYANFDIGRIENPTEVTNKEIGLQLNINDLENYTILPTQITRSNYLYNINDDLKNVFEEFENEIEIDLDEYLYVILTLKNYDINEPYQTNLQVKGQIGITPIYNYGQTTKDTITGVKVQDRCNISYENYTTYPLYILKQDLQNNVVYAIKECEQNSSFKYDSSKFNIFYVTEENKNDPTITINGKTYHTIPFDDLPSTANKNEEENYIPGESGSINSEGGLSGALKGIQQKMSEIWDIITFFTGFVNQMFSILPDPLQIILLSAFAIAITLGLIKIFIN